VNGIPREFFNAMGLGIKSSLLSKSDDDNFLMKFYYRIPHNHNMEFYLSNQLEFRFTNLVKSLGLFSLGILSSKSKAFSIRNIFTFTKGTRTR
jgi:hypothetical protein